MRKLLYFIILLNHTIIVFPQQCGYNDSNLEIAFQYYYNNIDSIHSVYSIEIYNSSDTLYYNIGYVNRMSIVFLRIPSYYHFLLGKLLLIQTGVETEKRAFDEIEFNRFYELLKTRLKNDVVINAFNIFEYTVSDIVFEAYKPDPSYILVLHNKKVISYNFSGSPIYFPVNYIRHYKYEETIDPYK